MILHNDNHLMILHDNHLMILHNDNHLMILHDNHLMILHNDNHLMILPNDFSIYIQPVPTVAMLRYCPQHCGFVSGPLIGFVIGECVPLIGWFLVAMDIGDLNQLIILTLYVPELDHYQSTLQWRHNERDGVSNHQPHDCLLRRWFRHRSKKTSKLCITGLCEGNSPVTGHTKGQ